MSGIFWQAVKTAGILLRAALVLTATMAPGCSGDAGTVRIGAVYPLSGAQAPSGQGIRNSILLAVDIINNPHELNLPLARSAGLDNLGGSRVEVVFADSESTAAAGREAAGRLIHEQDVCALMGSYQSAVTAETSAVAEEEAIPFLAAESSAPSLTRRGFKWFFRTTPDEETFVANFFEFFDDIRNTRGIQVDRLAIVSEDSIFGTEVAALAAEQALLRGYQVVANISYPAGTADVAGEVQMLADADPQVVLHASFINDAVLFLRTYAETGFRPEAILADNAGFIDPEFLRALGPAGNYILTRETWARDLAGNKPIVGVINQMYRDRYGTDMDGNSARAFAGMLVLAEAINRAGSTRPEDIRAALLATDLDGSQTIMPWGGVRFDPQTQQNTLGRGIISQILNLEYRTVWPPELATVEIVWPMPVQESPPDAAE
jgi:branched-chain amino acid transport system substrate-binding protein